MKSLLGSNPLVLAALTARTGHIEFNPTSGQQPRLITPEKEIALSEAIFNTLVEANLITESANSTPTMQIFELSTQGADEMRAELRTKICESSAFVLDLDEKGCVTFMDAAGYHITPGGLGEVKFNGFTNAGDKCRWASHWKHHKAVSSVGNRPIDSARVQVHEIWARLTAADRVTVGDRFAAAVIKK